ncbi:unnamed protein product [marine sediment metagenome]|uniref:Uncharacterized protein n=2 Tax=marine sediment metagenome TaxID=412755 RepID=X1JHP3_9ZZZZ
MGTKATAVATRTRYLPAKKRRRSNPGFTVPLGIVAGFVPYLINLKQGYDAGGWGALSMYGVRSLTGYNYEAHSFSLGDMRYGLLPILLGMGVHKIVGSKLGVNRMLGRAKVPFIRI